jgi:presenilin-like A22 family membrane protease
MFKLVINLVATIVLLLYMQTLQHLGDVAAAAMALSVTGFRGLSDPSPALHATAALLLLLAATTLAIYKPRGMTRYGQRTQHRQRPLRLP